MKTLVNFKRSSLNLIYISNNIHPGNHEEDETMQRRELSILDALLFIDEQYHFWKE